MTRPGYPTARLAPIAEVLHGETVADPYRWLEDGRAAEVAAWTAAQSALTAEVLAAVPARAAIRARLTQLLAIGALGAPTPARGRIFYLRRDSGCEAPVLHCRDAGDGTDRVVLDPNGAGEVLRWYFPSRDGRWLAFGRSRADEEVAPALEVLDVATGIRLRDRVPGVVGGAVAWLPDGAGFYYTRGARLGEGPALCFHRLGADDGDDRTVFRPAREAHRPSARLSPDGRWLLVSVVRAAGETDLHLQDRAAGGPLVPVVQDVPATFDAQVMDDRLYIRTNRDAPNYRLYVCDPANPRRAAWREIVPARGEALLEGVMVTRRRLVLRYVESACARLRLAGLDAEGQVELPLPTLGSIFGWGADPDADELLVGFSSFAVPPTIYRIDLASGAIHPWHRVDTDIDPARFQIEQVSFPSRDGTRVSVFVVHPRTLVRDGAAPAYLTGYGGFGVSMIPAFSRSLALWLDRGGVLAVPNLRGGGEHGEAWHQAGTLARKQNTFDDFIAAAQFLIDRRYTSPERLAVGGASNGGLLIGAAITQRPELFRAAVVQAPLLDMLRYHRFPMGEGWIPEYGSADHPASFRWLRAYSPYHQIRDDVAYPAVLLVAAEDDQLVDPLHARKMAARLQAATSAERPILLRLDRRAPEQQRGRAADVLDELTDVWSFVWAGLGL